MYLTEAEKQDTQVTESWKGDTDGILVFVSSCAVPLVHIHRLKHVLKTGLFSATVAAFIIESYKTLSPDSGDTANALLAQISVQLVNIAIQTNSVCRQGQRAVVPQFNPQLELCAFRDIDATMGPTVSGTGAPRCISQTRAHAGIYIRWH